MNYTKPEVVVLGEAVCVIEEFTAKVVFLVLDFIAFRWPALNPAYDLDE